MPVWLLSTSSETLRNTKKATIVAYGDYSDEEKDIFRQLVGRNAHNMNFTGYDILFTASDDADGVVEKIVSQWKKY